MSPMALKFLNAIPIAAAAFMKFMNIFRQLINVQKFSVLNNIRGGNFLHKMREKSRKYHITYQTFQ